MLIYAGRLSIKHRMDAIKPHCEILKTIYQYHIINGVPSKRMKQEITSFRDHLDKLLQDMDIDRDEKSSTSNSDDDEMENDVCYEDQETNTMGSKQRAMFLQWLLITPPCFSLPLLFPV